MSTVSYPHLEVDDAGRAWVVGKQTRVVQIVLDRLAHHWNAEDIQKQYPDLTLAEIHSALAYYYDHQADVDQQIADELANVERMQEQTLNRALQSRLRSQRKTP